LVQITTAQEIGSIHVITPGLTILIAEDEALIAHDLATSLEQAGATVTTTNSLEHALMLAENDGLSAAIIDHALIDGDTSELRIKLRRLGIPFVLYSGFERPSDVDPARHVSKPAQPETLISALMALFTARTG
jgi:CheY-like chemotaxis protein